MDLDTSCGGHRIVEIVIIASTIDIDGPGGIAVDEGENISRKGCVIALECVDVRFRSGEIGI